ncbi:MAG: hypothetical protein QOE93_2375 [Actinomycetota bacterium]|nr:hypothetical protein [Actinomycetota bacterium]
MSEPSDIVYKGLARLTALHVGNFKCFGAFDADDGSVEGVSRSPIAGGARIELGEVTLVYGANSAGKSTLLQAILVLAQSFQAATPSAGPLVLSGPLVDVGSFESAVHRHELRRPVILGFEYSLGTVTRGGTTISVDGEELLEPEGAEPTDGGRVLAFRRDEKRQEVTLAECAYRFLPDQPDRWLRFKPTSHDDRPRLEPAGECLDAYLEFVGSRRGDGLAPLLAMDGWAPGAITGWIDPAGGVLPTDDRDTEAVERAAEFGAAWRKQSLAALKSIRHVGGMRQAPSRRATPKPHGETAQLGAAGEGLAAIVAGDGGRVAEASKWFKRMGIAYSVDLVRYVPDNHSPKAQPSTSSSHWCSRTSEAWSSRQPMSASASARSCRSSPPASSTHWTVRW